MKKQSIRSFGFGLLAASASLFIFNETETNKPAELSTEEMIQVLTEENYTVQKVDSKEASQQAAAPIESNEAQNQTEEPATESVTVLIEQGSSSNEAAAKLKQSGILEDESSFNQYLIENGYADKLQVGSFTFQNGMTQQEIAEVLTK
ncbi:endolytic transglycosylase MltG [Domibacillus sp. A3M-37]|uniref:endolytic transglycosylase MltG n=1 Tax=Domibacillus TaxID=1433999 RepID=UPI0006180A6E|nr:MULTISPECIES: endolytic transglycosylase MltG [Domibacillus]MCP3764238.1 endolytic transglycosylase MltG [Domibacillus sp. A3M-37]